MKRCSWASNESDQVMIEYHDNEYGIMVDDNDKLFELLSLELMQSGLSWKVILDKRANFNKRFNNFILEEVAKMNEKNISELMEASDIVRNRLKIIAIINNAQLIVQKQIDLKDYILFNYKKYQQDYLACAKAYKKMGFKFIGPSTIESLYCALGLVEGHERSCYRYGKGNVI
ncbi:DNA-3-methyladenine glycosylase I [Erysipelotrichaceae bacterium OttesenSCG-928-M19]|nr:DNA-3-methyladenine glycosylase I [Erysipelotrichaceae bacterium OttesenSCG-928-M19]